MAHFVRIESLVYLFVEVLRGCVDRQRFSYCIEGRLLHYKEAQQGYFTTSFPNCTYKVLLLLFGAKTGRQGQGWRAPKWNAICELREIPRGIKRS